MATDTKIDSAGRVLIPAKLRRALGLESGARLNIRMEEDQIILESRVTGYKRARNRILRRLQGKKPAMGEVESLWQARQEDAAHD